MNIACDFDGTIVTHDFPNIGNEVPGAIATLKTLQDEGHKVFLWTMRGYHPSHKRCLEEAVEWCESKGLYFDAINRTTSDFSTSSPKQHANIYIDDAALGCPLCKYKDKIVADWYMIGAELYLRKIITKEHAESISEQLYKSYKQSGLTYCPYRIIHYPNGL